VGNHRGHSFGLQVETGQTGFADHVAFDLHDSWSYWRSCSTTAMGMKDVCTVNLHYIVTVPRTTTPLASMLR
jgi:hypothetical protein